MTQVPMSFMLPATTWTEPTELPDLVGSGVLAIDTETRDIGLAHDKGPGWVHGEGRIVGVSVASERGSVYVPIGHPDTKNFDKEVVARWLQDQINRSRGVVYQNAPYDIGWLQADMNVLPPPHEKLNDTIGMAYMLDEQRLQYGLDSLCATYKIPGKDETMLRQAAKAHGVDPKGELWKLPARFVAPYGVQDAVATLTLHDRLLPMLEAQEVLEPYHMEMELLPMVLAMRRRGIRVNVDKAEQVRDELLRKRDEALVELSRRLMIGRGITIKDAKSRVFLGKIFRQEGIPVPSTDKGGDSFEAEWMSKMDHWLPQLVARSHKMNDAGEKFVGTYILGFVKRGRIHPEVHQYKNEDGGTKTSRFAYANPPLQQMPSRDPEIADHIRSVFEPEHGEIWGALDYSQQEYRLIVHFANLCKVEGAQKPVRMYEENPKTDFHDMVAEMTRLPRRRAKDVNFAKAFGAGVAKFALMTGMTLTEAETVMNQYDEEAPFVKRLSEFVQGVAGNRGYIKLIDGARVRFDKWEPRWIDRDKLRGYSGPTGACDIEEARRRIEDDSHPWHGSRLRRAFTHKAMNWLIQGSAARQTKRCMVACWRDGLLPILQMHDELDFSFSDPDQAIRAQYHMVNTIGLSVPVVVDAEFGVNWGKAKAVKDKDTKEIIYGATWDEAWSDMRRSI